MAPRPRRICFIGPECTGKTELALRLARALDAVCVAEYAREYAETCGHVLGAADVEEIARGQMARENAVRDAELLVLDTDLISTVVYARHYYGDCPQWIVDEARARRADLYLLMDTDVVWQSDGVRDRGGEEREELFDDFRCALEEFGAHFVIISGLGEARWSAILSAAKDQLSRNEARSLLG